MSLEEAIRLVELLRRYSNREDLLKPLVSVLKRISEEPPVTEEEAQLVSADGPTSRAWHVSDRLLPTGGRPWGRPTLPVAPSVFLPSSTASAPHL